MTEDSDRNRNRLQKIGMPEGLRRTGVLEDGIFSEYNYARFEGEPDMVTED